MVANYFLGAVILMLTSDTSYSTRLCSCSEYIFNFSADCCREPILEDRTTQKPGWDMWLTRTPPWFARTTTQMPLWKRSTTRFVWEPILEDRTTQKPGWDMWLTRTPPWFARTTTQMPLWKRSTTRFVWSTTPSSYTDVATIIGASVGGVSGLAFLCCFIAACVRVKRVQQRRSQGHLAQPQPQCQPRDRGILFIVIRRILVRRCLVSADEENLISNQQVNSDISQTTDYAYNQGPMTSVAPPPYSPASPYVPPPPYSEYI